MSLCITKPNLYKDFKFRAEVDYLCLEAELKRPSNFTTVKRLTSATYVEALDATPSHAASMFRMRFDDVVSYVQLCASMEALKTHAGGFNSGPRLTEIETALDSYSRTQDGEALLDMTERMFRLGAAFCSDNTRLTRHKGEVVSAENPVLFRCRLAQSFTLQIGDIGAPIRQRIYMKTTDKGGTLKLPVSEHRARREVTLRGEGLTANQLAFPSLDLSETTRWKFEALAPWFRFRKVRENSRRTALEALLLDRQIILGSRAPRSHRRLYDPRVEADTRLNELARSALRELTKRFFAANQRVS